MPVGRVRTGQRDQARFLALVQQAWGAGTRPIVEGGLDPLLAGASAQTLAGAWVRVERVGDGAVGCATVGQEQDTRTRDAPRTRLAAARDANQRGPFGLAQAHAMADRLGDLLA